MVLEKLNSKSKWCILLAGCVGLCSGLGYLVRPEALLPAVLAVALWLIYQLRRNNSWRLTLASAGVTIAATLVCVMPYVLAIGGLTKKKSLSDLVTLSGANDFAVATASIGSTGWVAAAGELLKHLFEALHPLVGAFVCIWLACYVISRIPRFRSERVAVPLPHPAPVFMITGTLVVMGLLLMNLQANVGYLSHRHVMFLCALLSPLAGAGVVIVTESLTLFLERIGIPKTSKTLVQTIIIGIVLVGLSLHTLRPLHGGKSYFRRAGRFLEETMVQGDYLLTDHPWILHYSQAEGEQVWADGTDANGILSSIIRTQATYIAMRDRTVEDGNTAASSKLVPPMFIEIEGFAEDKSEHPDVIRIFRIAHTRAQ